MRSVSGIIYCEPCLAAKLGVGGAAGTAPGSYTVSGSPSSGYQYTVNQGGYTATGSTNGDVNFTATGPMPPPNTGPNPGAALALGFIPGVGAMYNGQFVKAMVHVLVFVILVSVANNHDVFGIFVAAWVFYQVFDAFQTAKARREGLPLPDPFGLNELGAKLGVNPPKAAPYSSSSTYQPFTAAPPHVPPGAPPAGSAAGFTGTTPDYTAASTHPSYTPVPPAEAQYGDPAAPFTPVPQQPQSARREPMGAIVLIGLGVLFLLNTLDVFRFDWLKHLWPLLIIALGAWMLIRRNAEVKFSARIGKDPLDRSNDTPTPPPAGGAQ
ncbi:LiaI-LiaF-like domain-containing protein [Silvibacterium dinghuense]|uniref:LiaI-LiaF-like domain-containing protein n=1 Tax=Silvibacterium dinghuense TaxID=1560006 RepID=UPI001E443858|nr:DUF5668 domain-containing protein [Silvibacterium dinghuense]